MSTLKLKNYQIKLAEAIGWRWEQHPKSWHYSHVYPEMGVWFRPDGSAVADLDCGCKVAPPFDPFTDANDDYAVLEWIRSDSARYESVPEMGAWQYEIGDYARAALKLI